MKTRWIVAALVLVYAAANASVHAAGEGERSFHGIARAQQDMTLKFAVAGRIAEVRVREGQEVSIGDVLVRLDDRDAREQVEVLRLRAESTIEIDSAQAAYDLATNEEQRVKDAYENGGANEFELRRAALATLQARLTLALRQRQQQEAEAALRRAVLALEEFTCISSIDGVVEELVIDEGEIVERHAPVVRVVRPDPLRIEVYVPTELTLALRADESVTVHVELPGNDSTFAGRIVRFAQVADAASGTRMVIIEADKPAQLPAGIRVRVEFNPGEN